MGPIAFPYKLWEIVEHSSAPDSECPALIRWSDDGSSILVDELNFELFVAMRYPKFIRRNTLDCLQKQLYQYKFELAPGDMFGILQYWHPCFLRGRLDLLLLVTSRQTGKAKQPELPKPPLSWTSYHRNHCWNGDHSSDSCHYSDKARNLNRHFNRSTNQYKFWRRTGRIAAFAERNTYSEMTAAESMSHSFGHGDAYGEAPALLDFLDKTSSSLKEALEVGESAIPSERAAHATVNPKMFLKVSLKDSLQSDKGFTMLNTPPPLLPQARARAVNIDGNAPRQLIVIAPAEAVVVKSEPTDELNESEMMSTVEEATPSSSTPPFALLNTPTAIKMEPDIRDVWFSGETRAYYAL